MAIAVRYDDARPALVLTGKNVAGMISGDEKAATRMNLWGKIKDLFRTEKKEDALKALFRVLDSEAPVRSFHAFTQLGRMATDANRTLFSVAVKPNEDGGEVRYSVNGHVVKAERVSSQERDMILTLMGTPMCAEDARVQVSSLDDYRLETDLGVLFLQTGDFASGGAHKRFAAHAGVLQARDDIGREDFVRESQLATYAESRPDLQNYVSTQQPIAAPPGVDAKFAYARVAQYDPQHIVCSELDAGLNTLSLDQARSVVVQLVDMVRTFYGHKVSHRDLHMQNLLLHTRREDGAVFLKAIDFGRAQFGEGFVEAERFNDIDYLFGRVGCSFAETVGRNYLAPRNSAVALKHYPLHKLLNHFDVWGAKNVTEILSGIGNMLKADLEEAGEDERRIDQAFTCASASVQMALTNSARPIWEWAPSF